jgi:hypothetical protein
MPSRFDKLIQKWAKSPDESIKQASGPIRISYRFVMIGPRNSHRPRRQKFMPKSYGDATRTSRPSA